MEFSHSVYLVVMVVVFVDVTYEFFYSLLLQELPSMTSFISCFFLWDAILWYLWRKMSHAFNTEGSISRWRLTVHPQERWNEQSFLPLDAVQTRKSCHDIVISGTRSAFRLLQLYLTGFHPHIGSKTSASKRQVSFIDKGVYSFQTHSLCIFQMVQYLLFITSLLMSLQCF